MKKEQHGLVADRSVTVLIILDLLSDFAFPDGKAVLRSARRIAPRIARLKKKAREAGIATCYVNDNPGRWRSDLTSLLRELTKPEARGADVVRSLLPHPQDYFILKPRHSAFYATPLEVLLNHLGARRLILTGVSAHQCVLFTANDAHVRNFELSVPRDCIGAPTASETTFAARYFDSVLNADTRNSTELRLRSLARSR
jgi:nicotinamidase-related amidase